MLVDWLWLRDLLSRLKTKTLMIVWRDLVLSKMVLGLMMYLIKVCSFSPLRSVVTNTHSYAQTLKTMMLMITSTIIVEAGILEAQKTIMMLAQVNQALVEVTMLK
jgi:hypothetical protein